MERGVVSQVDNITGLYHLEPICSYLKNWMAFSVGTLFFVAFLYKKEETREDSIILGIVTLLIFFLVNYIYWFEPLARSGIMESKQFFFWFLGALQILVALFLIEKKWLIELVNTRLKSFFLVTAVLYIGVLCLGFYCADLHDSIIRIGNAQNWRDNDGMRPGTPIVVFYLVFEVVLLITTTLSVCCSSTVVDYDRMNTLLYESYVTIYLMVIMFWGILVFSIGLALFTDDMEIDVNIVAVSLFVILFIIPPLFFSLIGKNKHAEVGAGYSLRNSDVLDENIH
jgi:hypothetical protein